MGRTPKRCSKGLKRVAYLYRKCGTDRSKYSRPRTQSRLSKIGSKAQVWHGTATKTSGGLTKDKLIRKCVSKGKKGKKSVFRIVSKKQSAHGKKVYKLVKASFTPQQKAMKADPIGFRSGKTAGKRTRKRTVAKFKKAYPISKKSAAAYARAVHKLKGKNVKAFVSTHSTKKPKCPSGKVRSRKSGRCVKRK